MVQIFKDKWVVTSFVLPNLMIPNEKLFFPQRLVALFAQVLPTTASRAIFLIKTGNPGKVYFCSLLLMLLST